MRQLADCANLVSGVGTAPQHPLCDADRVAGPTGPDSDLPGRLDDADVVPRRANRPPRPVTPPPRAASRRHRLTPQSGQGGEGDERRDPRRGWRPHLPYSPAERLDARAASLLPVKRGRRPPPTVRAAVLPARAEQVSPRGRVALTGRPDAGTNGFLELLLLSPVSSLQSHDPSPAWTPVREANTGPEVWQPLCPREGLAGRGRGGIGRWVSAAQTMPGIAALRQLSGAGRTHLNLVMYHSARFDAVRRSLRNG